MITISPLMALDEYRCILSVESIRKNDKFSRVTRSKGEKARNKKYRNSK